MTKQISIHLDGTGVSLPVLREVPWSAVKLTLSKGIQQQIAAAESTVNHILDRGDVVYGINTGFGLLAQTSIPREQLATLQRNLILSHSTGVGALLEDEVVKLILVLKIIGLCRGHSGTRLKVIEALIALVEHEVFPCIPSKGSVGASGDLAPLAHLAAALLGVGQVRHQNKTIPAQEGLEIAGLKPVELAPKEGLAFINGTQVSTALALMGLFGAERNFAAGLFGRGHVPGRFYGNRSSL